MKKHRINITLIILLFLPLISFALATDNAQPVYLQADQAHLNRKTGIGIFKGHVEFKQGTTIVKGDKMIAYQNEQKQFIKVVVTGNPASYQTLPNTNKPIFVALGETINYFPQKNLAEFIGQAHAEQGVDNINAPQINYDINRNVMSSPLSKNGRTKITLDPKRK